MDTLATIILEQAKSQGFAVSLLIAAVWYFYKRQERQERLTRQSQEQIVKYLQEDRVQLVQLVEELGSVIEQNTLVLKAIEKKL
jgi:hypothetical protein